MTVTDYMFDKDIFLVSENVVAASSTDRLDSRDWSGTTNDFTDGEPFARELLSVFPGRRSLIDLGTATGQVPLTMRHAGMLAIGLEGSEKSRERKIGAWGEMPGVVRTCDIGKPFEIRDSEGNGVKFDFVTSWGVLEHIPEGDFDGCLKNIQNLMHDESWGIMNIDIGYNPADNFHLLWTNFKTVSDEVAEKHVFLRERLSAFFDVIYATGASETRLILIPPTRDPVGEEARAVRYWNYCRPNISEKLNNDMIGSHIQSGRSFWWIRKKRTT